MSGFDPLQESEKNHTSKNGDRGQAPIFGCATSAGPRRLHLNNCVQESHPHRPLPRLHVPPSTGPQACSGQDIAQQGRSSDVTAKDQETRQIRQALISNGYPRGIIQHQPTRDPQMTSLNPGPWQSRLCNVLTTASLWTSGWWVLILENVGVTEQLLLVYLVAILRVRYREGQYCCD